MRGHIRRRGANSWELKFDAGRDHTGKRKIQYVSFKGTRREAQAKLTDLLAAIGQGDYVEPSKVTVIDFVRARVDQWEAAGNISARTAQRYRQLAENQIAPHLGNKQLQKLSRLDIEGWHTALRNGGLAARTIDHAHRVLSKALRDAERDDLISNNVCKLQKVPKVAQSEMVIVRNVPAFVSLLREAAGRLYAPAIVALFAGMRLGEVLAVRERSVNLDTGVIEVREALEETHSFGVRFKTAKTTGGRRNITLPTIAIEALRDHRKQLLETRLLLGQGKLAPDDLLFANLEGGPLRPSSVSSDWGSLAERMGHARNHIPRAAAYSRLSAYRQRRGYRPISKRLGHAKPSV